jgi:hypothetical protein
VRYLETRAWEPRSALRTLRQAMKADLVYLVGGQIGRLSRPHLLRLALRTPFVMHWAGTDVLYAREVRARGEATSRLVGGVSHWAGAPWLAEELGRLGVGARWLPHSWVDAPATLPPLPGPADGPFTLLTYLPEGRADFYGGDAIRRLAAALPEARVLVTGTRSLPWTAPNVRCLGWVEQMAPLYAQSHVLVRLPRHDGLAFMVQEALAFGRYVVWTYPFAGAVRAANADDAVLVARELYSDYAHGELPPNEVGATHVRRRFNRDRIRADLLAGFGEILSG